MLSKIHNRPCPWSQLFNNLFKRTLHQNAKILRGTQTVRGINDLHTAEYYFENGLRKVKPYHYYFRTYAKERMFGSTVLDVFLQEYRGRSESYYRYAIEKGLLTVNHQKTTPDTIVKRQDLLSHAVHRHEPPVVDEPIHIIHEDNDLVVINKPGSIQVHPSGRYRHNTVTHIMRKELNYDRLFPCNRLDRITSGLMVICKNTHAADTIALQMRTGAIEKEYICRVSGEFPSEPIVCQVPIKTLDYKVSLNYVHPTGKPCTTLFERLDYNGRTSLVRCKPLSGRTHQIRVHLRYLGYPIANDPIYGFSNAWSDQLPTSYKALDQPARIQSISDTMIETAPYDYMDDDPLNKSNFPRCQECNVPVTNTDPILDQLALWLHAYKYSGQDWSFETPILPLWAQATFKQDENIVVASF